MDRDTTIFDMDSAIMTEFGKYDRENIPDYVIEVISLNKEER